MPVALAFAAFLALVAGSRAGWRTQAEYQDDQKLPGTPTVQGGTGPHYWFFWWIWVNGKRSSYGAAYLSDQDAWNLEFRTRSQNLGCQMQRWVWTGSRWMLDERPDTQLLAQAPIPGYSVGAVALDPPVRGRWTAPGFPPSIRMNGREFRKAAWLWPREGVVAQYREAVPENSQHLFVLADGTFIVDHVDETNPDAGNPLAHFLEDVLLRPAPELRT